MTLIDTIIRLVLATVLGSLIGYERQHKGTGAGLRTHILVCLGSALVMLLSVYTLSLSHSGSFDAAQIAGTVMTGIGFLGAGAIIKNAEHATGLTTAASIWMSASIGLATGAGYFSGAIISTLITIFTLYFLKKIEHRI
jgi:putative Mg2+ transporter-C (MgtC) family protein